MGGTTTPFHGSPLKEVELGPKAEIINKLLCNCDSFDDEIYSKVTLYVPAESVELYQTTMPWILFNKIVGVDFAEIDEIGTDVTDEDAPVEYFNLSGVKVNGDNLSKGIYLRRQGSTVTKIAVK